MCWGTVRWQQIAPPVAEASSAPHRVDWVPNTPAFLALPHWQVRYAGLARRKPVADNRRLPHQLTEVTPWS